MTVTVLDRPPDEVRVAVREVLTQDRAHEALPDTDRREIAQALVRIAHAAKLLDEETTKAPKPRIARALNAEGEYGGSAVANMADTARRTLQAISFPRFVAELIQGVFRAMVETNQVQLQQYLELIRGVSQSLDGFASLGGNSDDPAKRWLADQFPASFAIEVPDPPDPRDIPDPDEEIEPIRLTSRGSPPSADALRAALSLEADAEVPTDTQALVGFVKRSLARNRQQMLATMVQMGMQRIVIDSGRIHASMRFHIDATSAAAEQAHTGFDARHSVSASASGGFGPFSASASVSSTIGFVRTTDTQTEERTNASADLNSSVELQFRTDQVPLDRLASQQTVQRLQLNTLNPEREMQIANETDRARITANQAVNTARASAPRTELAPTAPAAPAAPARGGSGTGGTTSAGGGGGTTGTAGGAGTSGSRAGGSAGGSGTSGGTGTAGSATATGGSSGTAAPSGSGAGTAGTSGGTATGGTGTTGSGAGVTGGAATGGTGTGASGRGTGTSAGAATGGTSSGGGAFTGGSGAGTSGGASTGGSGSGGSAFTSGGAPGGGTTAGAVASR